MTQQLQKREISVIRLQSASSTYQCLMLYQISVTGTMSVHKRLTKEDHYTGELFGNIRIAYDAPPTVDAYDERNYSSIHPD